MPKKLVSWILENEWLILVCCAVILIRIPSWFEPYWYGDEAIYITIGQALNRGTQLYSQIHDNKPPFLYLMAAAASGKLFWFKAVATVWNTATVVAFAVLAKKIFSSRTAKVAAVWLFALATSWPKLEGNIANAELFFLLPTIAAASVLWGKNPSAARGIIGGLLIGLAALFKVPAILEAGVWPLLWLVSGEKRWLKISVLLGIGILIPIGLSFGYYLFSGAIQEYWTAAWAQNIPYLSSWKPGGEEKGIFDLKNRVGGLAVILAIIFGLGKRWGKNAMFISAWLGITVFAALLSGRPYPHYLLQTVPAGVLAIISLIFDRISAKLILASILAGTGGLIFAFGFYDYKVIDYYRNFWAWTTGTKNTREFIGWYGQQNLINYDLASRVKLLTLPQDKIFVWGDEPMIYALSERQPATRYIVKYHVKDFRAEKMTLEELQVNKPGAIVNYGAEEELPGFAGWLDENYRLETVAGGAKVFVRKSGL